MRYSRQWHNSKQMRKQHVYLSFHYLLSQCKSIFSNATVKWTKPHIRYDTDVSVDFVFDLSLLHWRVWLAHNAGVINAMDTYLHTEKQNIQHERRRKQTVVRLYCAAVYLFVFAPLTCMWKGDMTQCGVSVYICHLVYFIRKNNNIRSYLFRWNGHFFRWHHCWNFAMIK